MVFPGDTVEQNNRLGAYARVSGVPGILLAEGAPGEGEELKKLLSAAGMQVETVLPAMLPDAPEGYTPYQAVALANVDADSLSAAQISALEGAARELGRRVAVLRRRFQLRPGQLPGQRAGGHAARHHRCEKPDGAALRRAGAGAG